MADKTFLSWPFFEERHRELAAALEDWCREVVRIADAGLRHQGEDASYLNALREVIASGRSPGELWPASGPVGEVLKGCEYAAQSVTAAETNRD